MSNDTYVLIIIIVTLVIIITIVYSRALMVSRTIPKISCNGNATQNTMRIFRTWKSREMNQKMIERCHKRWLDLNTNIRMEWFDDDDCIAFMKTQSSQIYDAYVTLKPTAFKADLFRLCILYENGGMYVDAQTMPYASIREMLRGCYDDNQRHVFVSVLDRTPGGIHNGFIFCSRKHPFIYRAIERIIENVKNRDYTDHVLGVTGPICLYRAINDVLGRDCDTLINKGLNNFQELSFYLYEHRWNMFQTIHKNGKLLMCKKHCIMSYFFEKLKPSSYTRLWRNHDIYN